MRRWRRVWLDSHDYLFRQSIRTYVHTLVHHKDAFTRKSLAFGINSTNCFVSHEKVSCAHFVLRLFVFSSANCLSTRSDTTVRLFESSMRPEPHTQRHRIMTGLFPILLQEFLCIVIRVFVDDYF